MRCLLQHAVRATGPLGVALDSTVQRLSGMRHSHPAVSTLWTSVNTCACYGHHQCHQQTVSLDLLPTTQSSCDHRSALLKMRSLSSHIPITRPSSILCQMPSSLLMRNIHQDAGGSKKQAQKQFILSPQGFVSCSPPVVQPYMRLMRLDRPIGIN